MPLEYSTEVLQVSYVNQKYRNSIAIYTEDNDIDKEFYVKLLGRLMDPTGVVINDIYPLGSSNEVINACRNDNRNDVAKLYIVDGDIYLQYKPKEQIANLHILDSYCIENYVIDENSICQTYYELLGDRPIDKIRTSIKYTECLGKITNHLIELFWNFSIQQQYCNVFKVFHINTFIDNNCTIQQDKIENRIGLIKKEILDNGTSEDMYNKELQLRKTAYPISIETLLTIVSGKNYLLPYFQKHCGNQLSSNIKLPSQSWKFHFAKYCNLDRLEMLKQAIINAVN